MNEKLSQLVDEELDAGSTGTVLDALVEDAELRDRWHRFHLIGAVLRHDWEASVHPAELADRIHAAVMDEDATPSRRGFSSLATWGTGLAASAAAISLLGWLMAAPGPVPAPQLASAPASDSPVTRVATNSSAGLNNTVVAGTHWDTLSPETVRRLNAYLVEHGEFSSMQGLSGVTSYARFVSNDD